MKDNFSNQSRLYANFRPSYPSALIQEILNLCDDNKLAWDCGTGNGQVAKILSPYFEKVVATDISENQLKHAIKAKNITYKKTLLNQLL